MSSTMPFATSAVADISGNMFLGKLLILFYGCAANFFPLFSLYIFFDQLFFFEFSFFDIFDIEVIIFDKGYGSP